MKGYIVCVYESIKDKDALKDYALKAREAVEKYDGKFQTLEGEDYPRTVIWEFPSYEQAIKCHDSKEYQAGWALAKDTTERNLQIIEGVNIE